MRFLKVSLLSKYKGSEKFLEKNFTRPVINQRSGLININRRLDIYLIEQLHSGIDTTNF